MVFWAHGNGMPKKIGVRILSTSGPPKATAALTPLKPRRRCAPWNALTQLRSGPAPGAGHWARSVKHDEKPTQRRELNRAFVPGNQELSTLEGSETPPLLPCPV